MSSVQITFRSVLYSWAIEFHLDKLSNNEKVLLKDKEFIEC
ncbi:Uncharacterised protein [Legionella lansingensis]|nr:Uncharacterised protein [Legionella lansingensis]